MIGIQIFSIILRIWTYVLDLDLKDLKLLRLEVLKWTMMLFPHMMKIFQNKWTFHVTGIIRGQVFIFLKNTQQFLMLINLELVFF